jgi:hypothetical protein
MASGKRTFYSEETEGNIDKPVRRAGLFVATSLFMERSELGLPYCVV